MFDNTQHCWRHMTRACLSDFIVLLKKKKNWRYINIDTFRCYTPTKKSEIL